MLKNIFLITFLFFINSCGYTSVYKNSENQDFQITVSKTQGDRELNNLIKNEINLYSNKNSINKFDIVLNTNYEKLVLAKNVNGKITDYKLSANSSITIYFNEMSYKKNFSEAINIKNQTNTFEQNLYEKNILRNFASSIREKLLLEIINLK